MNADDLQAFLNATPDILAFTGAALMTAFTVFYLGFFAFRTTPTGRAFAAFIVSLDATLLLSVLFIIFGPHYPFRWLARDVVLVGIILSIGNFLRILYRKWHDPAPILIQPKPRRSSKR